MADDWEDWEDESFNPQVGKGKKEAETKTGAVLAGEPDMSKFAGEDEEVKTAPAGSSSQTKTQPKKEKEKAKQTAKAADVLVDEPLLDPAEEKLRQQRLQEEADFKATRELFGDGAAGPRLEDMLPKSEKDFSDFATALVERYVLPHAANKHYKHLLKNLFRDAVQPVSSGEMKDLETSMAGVRTEKLKTEQAASAAKKLEGKKKTINVGKGGGTAGLDDYVYDDALDDDVDFM